MWRFLFNPLVARCLPGLSRALDSSASRMQVHAIGTSFRFLAALFPRFSSGDSVAKAMLGPGCGSISCLR